MAANLTAGSRTCQRGIASIGDYIVLRGRELDVDDLYRRGGRYEDASGFHPAALIALVAGVLPCVAGFPNVAPLWKTFYSDAWFVGFAVAGGLCLLLMGGRAKRRP